MHRRTALLCLGPLLFASGCAGVGTISPGGPEEGVLLARRPAEPEGETLYRLFPGRGDPPRILRTRRVVHREPKLGLFCSSLNADLARGLRVEPWKGVFVERVDEDSAAARAGIVPGDILLSLDGQGIVSKQQFEELQIERLHPGETVEVEVLRALSTDPAVPRERLEVTFVPDLERVVESSSDSIPLTAADDVQRLTGLQAAEVPPDLARELFDQTGPALLVSGVVIGSPAYFAGFRSGDRIVALDGSSPVDLTALRARLAPVAAAQGIATPPLPLGVEPVGGPEPPRLTVDGPLGRHEAPLEVVAGLDGSYEIDVPILFDYESRVDRTRWSFLDFVFQFGASYRGRHLPTRTRSPAHWSRLSLFPFDMFEFESSPRGHRTVLFWFISFGRAD